jgi:uncharacterized protein
MTTTTSTHGLVERFQLQAHPEGGWFRETYRSSDTIASERGERSLSTAILFLLADAEFSAFHRIASDELWHYYCGTASIEVIAIDSKGVVTRTLVGNPLVDPSAVCQHTVPAGCWFASRVTCGQGFALVGCTCALGFDFADFDEIMKISTFIHGSFEGSQSCFDFSLMTKALRCGALRTRLRTGNASMNAIVTCCANATVQLTNAMPMKLRTTRKPLTVDGPRMHGAQPCNRNAAHPQTDANANIGREFAPNPQNDCSCTWR